MPASLQDPVHELDLTDLSDNNPSDRSGCSASSGTSDKLSDSFKTNYKRMNQHPDMIHPKAGYTYPTEGARSQCFEVQRSLHIQHRHLFSPWANQDEIWLADLIFTKARMSMSITNDLLNGF